MDKFVKKRSEPSTSSESVGKKTRLYNDSYLNYGFTSLDGKPQCVVCFQVLSDESMKPSKLVRHLESKHPAHKNKPLEFFERKLHTLRNQQTSICKSSHTDKSVLEASYLVALRVAKMSKPHTIAENLILPAAIDMVSVLIGVEEAKKLKKIPLSNDTISRRIDDMAADVRDQIILQVSSSEFFSIQFDESTDVANMSQFLCFVRYECDRDTSIKENMLFCKTVPGHATGQCLFDVFYEATRNYTNIDWTKCIAVCSDGAKAITGKNSGLMKILKDRLIPRAEWTHCFLHRHALVAKNMPENLNQILCEAVKMVNFIKSRPLQNRLFAKLCDEMGENKKSLLFHTEVRWLSRGKVLTRVLELRDELIIFFQDKQTPFSLFLQNNECMLLLAYLADVFSHLNDLNVNLQGRDKNILLMTDKVHAFIKKLDIWIIRLQSKNLDMFPLTSDYIEKNLNEQDTIIRHSLDCMKMHLRELKTQLTEYFPEDKNDFSKRWVLNPFSENVVAAAKLPVEIHDQLIEMSADKTLQLQFTSEDLNTFWLARRNEYGNLVTEALKILIPFATSYLCEKGFSSMVALKTKYRNRLLSLENNLLLCVSNVDPRMEKLLNEKQMQPSH